MEKSLKIAIDCDDVLVPTAETIVEAYKDRYGFTVELKNYYSSNPVHWGVENIQIAQQRVSEYLKSAKSVIIPPFEDATASVGRLAKKHSLHMVTARNDDLHLNTRRLVDEYFPGCFQSLEFTNYYSGSEKRRSKGEVCRGLGIDILIDDNPTHIKSVLGSVSVWGVLFGNYPWNSEDEFTDSRISYCRSWPEVEAKIYQIATET